MQTIAKFFGVEGSRLQYQYKNTLSGFDTWKDKNHAEDWLIFPENIGKRVSIDETAFSNGDLYTIITNKAAKGKEGSLIAIIKGTKSEDVINILNKIPEKLRFSVEEITLDLAGSMNLIAKKSFPYASKVIDRFHVQKLAFDAVQEIRIKYRWKAIDDENNMIKQARNNKEPYNLKIFENGDTSKQLLARSRYLLFKSASKWTEDQKKRAVILFKEYPDIKLAYELSQKLSWIYENTDNKTFALTRLANWHEKVRQANFKTFNTVSRTIELNYRDILNYFNNRSTNASAESFNAKIKGFRTQLKGIRKVDFFMFRLQKLFA